MLFRIEALLKRHKEFVARGFEDDGTLIRQCVPATCMTTFPTTGVREALVVVKSGSDQDIVDYLHAFQARVARFKALSDALRSSVV